MKITRTATKTLATVTALLLSASLAGCQAAAQASAKALETIEPAPGTAPTAPVPVHPAATGDATNSIVLLDRIPVKGRAPKTGYSREEFGPVWYDTDHNGCDTRNDILARDLTGKTFKPGTNYCLVTTGTLADKYTGTTIDFVRGQETSTAGRSTTSSRCPTHGKKAPSNSASTNAYNSPTTP
jgi:hypothetical protein